MKSTEQFSNAIELNMLTKVPQSLNKSLVAVNTTVNSIIAHSKPPINSLIKDLLEIKRGFYNLYAEITGISRKNITRSVNPDTYTLCLKRFYESQPIELINCVIDNNQVEMVCRSFNDKTFIQLNNKRFSIPSIQNINHLTIASTSKNLSNLMNLKFQLSEKIIKQTSNQKEITSNIVMAHINKNKMNPQGKKHILECHQNVNTNFVKDFNGNLKRKYQNNIREIVKTAKDQNNDLWSIDDIMFDDLFCKSSDEEKKQVQLPRKRIMNQTKCYRSPISKYNLQKTNVISSVSYSMSLIYNCLEKNMQRQLVKCKRLRNTIQQKSICEINSNIETPIVIHRPAVNLCKNTSAYNSNVKQKSILFNSINVEEPKNKFSNSCIQAKSDYYQIKSSNSLTRNILSSFNKKSRLCHTFSQCFNFNTNFSQTKSNILILGQSNPNVSKQLSIKSDNLFNLVNNVHSKKTKDTNKKSIKLIKRCTQQVDLLENEQKRKITVQSKFESKNFEILYPSKSLKEKKRYSIINSSLTQFLNDPSHASSNIHVKTSGNTSNPVSSSEMGLVPNTHKKIDPQYPFLFNSDTLATNSAFIFNNATQATTNRTKNVSIVSSDLISNYNQNTISDTLECKYSLSTKSNERSYGELLRSDQHLNISSGSSPNSSYINCSKISILGRYNGNISETKDTNQQQSSIADPIQHCSVQLNSSPISDEMNKELNFTVAPPIEFM